MPTSPTDDVIARAEEWLCDDLNAWQFWAGRLIRDLCIELRTAREDTRRLDWLERTYFVLHEIDSGIGNGSNYCWRVEIDRASGGR